MGAIRKKIRPHTEKLQLSFGLDQVFPVPEGSGSLLVWAPARVGMTCDPQAHFAELVRMLDLRVSGVQDESDPVRRAPRLARQLSTFGERLMFKLGSAATERVRIRHTVTGLRDYESPLSWMNGRWHHSFPLDLRNVPEKEIIGKYERALGRIEVSIPPADVGFILAIGDNDSDVKKRMRDIETFIIARSDHRVDCMSAFRNPQGVPELEPLRLRVEKDVLASMSGASKEA